MLMKQFVFGAAPADARASLKESVLPIVWILLITGALVGLFAAFIGAGADMTPLIDPHLDEGEMVDPSPMRFAFMCLAFVAAFVCLYFSARAGRNGKTMAAFLTSYAGGTLLWQAVGECSWHFGIVTEESLICFTHIECASSLFFVILTTILIAYCYRRHAFEWAVWVFVLSFIGNWFGHFALIGTYPLVHTVMEESQWYMISGIALGGLCTLVSLYLGFFAAKTTKARLCSCLALYFSIGMIVTGGAGL